MRATCPRCGTNGCRVVAAFRQATRTRPVEFICHEGLCPTCAGPFTGLEPFRVEAGQLTLETVAA